MDFTDLEKKLETLTGLDFEAAEKAERLDGNFSPDISFSKSFQVRLAAMAMGLNHNELKALPMNKYNKLAQRVMNFLFADSEDTETKAESSDQKIPSTN